MCDFCDKIYDRLHISIEDNNGVRIFCPNCLCYHAQNDLVLENKELYICDVTGKRGAVVYKSLKEEYFLDKDIMMRLLRRSLRPGEYYILADKFGADSYMLHDDFYDPETGEALQPLED